MLDLPSPSLHKVALRHIIVLSSVFPQRLTTMNSSTAQRRFTRCLLFFFVLTTSLTIALSIPQTSPRGISTFNNGKLRRHGFPVDPTGSLYCNGPYGIENKAGIPFSRANRGKLLFYGKGEGNTPDGITD